MHPPPCPVRPGEIVAGKYRIERILGAGGMGVVVSATHLDLGGPVALKFLTVGGPVAAEAGARFAREARAMFALKSENAARVLDVGRLESGPPYIVMEYLEGCDLEATAAGGPLPIGVAVDYVVQATHAIAEAHALGIIHRDLKPQNLFVTQRPDGRDLVKVLDFGISKVSEPGDVSLTSSNAMMGSPRYMAPEQFTGSAF